MWGLKEKEPMWFNPVSPTSGVISETRGSLSTAGCGPPNKRRIHKNNSNKAIKIEKNSCNTTSTHWHFIQHFWSAQELKSSSELHHLLAPNSAILSLVLLSGHTQRCSGISPKGAQGTLWGARDRTQSATCKASILTVFSLHYPG